MKLTRLDQTDRETLGHLIDDEEKLLCCTLERPWLDNQHDVSCIPPGVYTCRRVHSPHFGCDVFQICDVPDRANVLIHWGNFFTDSEGCVLVGSSFADINHDGTMDVAASKDAFARFMATKAGIDSFSLTVLDPGTEATP